MKPAVVVLAAGMGSRYGGLKQLERVGPGGETIMDYSVYDARRAGFGRVVFVIRPEMREVFHQRVGSRYEHYIDVAYAFQRLDDLPDQRPVPPDRAKPWGTGHAVLAARDVIGEPFAVINADDFYGHEAFEQLAQFLADPPAGDVPTYALVAYTLRQTLSEAGQVNRGVCRTTPDGWLEGIRETLGIRPHGDDAAFVDEEGREQILPGGAPVSMNTWGFTPRFLGDLQERFKAFLDAHGRSAKAEFHLPAAVQELMQAGRARVKVLTSGARWCGVTYPQDKPLVEAHVRSLTEAGVYPQPLWGNPT